MDTNKQKHQPHILFIRLSAGQKVGVNKKYLSFAIAKG